MSKKRIVVSVINDIATDQRVRKVCQTLHDNGFDILLAGRKLKDSLPVNDRPYKVLRMKLLFRKGFFFYVFFNIRLFFVLLFARADIFHSNDLDTLLPNYLVSLIRRKSLVYDTHELFTEVPELTSRPLVQNFWKRIENFIFPKLKHVFTVNDSIANIYQKRYTVEVAVLRNLPSKSVAVEKADLSEFGLNNNKKMIILQGAGINVDRGAEELVEAMKYVDDLLLVIAGNGDVIIKLKNYVRSEQLDDRIVFLPRMPHEKLMRLTAAACCGITLDKDTNLNYRYSLPNKLFDYIKAGIPVISSDLPEIRKVFEEYKVGIIVESHDPVEIAKAIKHMVFDIPAQNWKEALQRASDALCWENEQAKLLSVYEQFR